MNIIGFLITLVNQKTRGGLLELARRCKLFYMSPLTTTHLPRAVLWDLDGTLIDTAPVHWRVWKEILAPEGVDLTWELFAPTFGQRNDTSLRIWLKRDLTNAEIERISSKKEALYREAIRAYPLEMLPGASDCLAKLRAAGWRQALATMTWRENLEAIFAARDFSGCFEAIVTADDVKLGKPDPEVFLLAAQRLDVLPERCIVVEDASAGIEAARRGGMRSIGIGAQTLLLADRVALKLVDLSEKVFDELVPL